jgi:diadenosine tetraphosphatase ApaH/serine/threonine PP2A family protein phosphatase
MEGSCPVCYEAYSADADAPNTARRLACGHVVCQSCITSEIFDDSYFCPECAEKHEGCLNDFSSVATADDISTPTSDDYGSDDFASLASRDSLSNAALASRSPRAVCSVPECQNKAMSMNGLCLQHSKKRHKSMTSAGIIAQNISNTSFYGIKSNSEHLFANSLGQDKEVMGPDTLMEIFKEQKRIELGEAMELIDAAKGILIHEPNILNIEAPVIAVGDVHGQYYDLVNLMLEGGKPGESEQYLFLGDYVDRGNFSCEVMFLLVALKVKYPTKIWLLRGNHECASVSGHFGFKEECKQKYGVNVYYNFLLLFQTMPLGAVISTAYGELFACHGGLSPSLKTIDDINKLNRLVEPEAEPGLLDMLWSDPISEDDIDLLSDEEYESYMNVEYRPNPARGCSFAFGYKALREFLNTNNLVCIIRAHEVQELGYRRHFEPEIMERRIKMLVRKRLGQYPSDGSPERTGNNCSISVGKEKDIPPLITIFSAPNYCDRYQNKGAILRIESGLDGFRVIQYSCVWHPVPEMTESQTDNYILAITAACPYMPTSFKGFVRRAVELGYEEEENLILDKDADSATVAVVAGEAQESMDDATSSAEYGSSNDGEQNNADSVPTAFANSSPRTSVTADASTPGTPKHEEFDANNNNDIIRHLRMFPVRRSSVRTGDISHSLVACIVTECVVGDGSNLFSPDANAGKGFVTSKEDDPENGNSVPSERSVLRRRSSITISMVRSTAADEELDEYIGPIIEEDSVDAVNFTPVGCRKSATVATPIVTDEFGLEMHDDISLDESSPHAVARRPSSGQQIRRIKVVSDCDGDVCGGMRDDNSMSPDEVDLNKNTLHNSLLGTPAAQKSSLSMRLFNSFEDNDANSPILKLQPTVMSMGTPIQHGVGVSLTGTPNSSRKSVVLVTPSVSTPNTKSAQGAAAATPPSSSLLSLSAATFSPAAQATGIRRGSGTSTRSTVAAGPSMSTPQGSKVNGTNGVVPVTGVSHSDSVRKTSIGSGQAQALKKRSNSIHNLSASDAYLEAQASDSINEVHPEMLKV